MSGAPDHRVDPRAEHWADPLAEHLYHRIGDTVMVEGAGVEIVDREGRAYLDCISGTFNLLLGHNHPAVLAAARAQMDRLMYAASSFQTEPLQTLVAALARVSPPNLTRVHLRSTGGSTANEGAVRIAQHVTGKRDVITMFRGHLGQTLATASLSGFASQRAPFPYHLPGAVHVPDPYCYRCFYGQRPETCDLPCVSRIADFIEYASSGSVACVIVEPIFGAGGNITPPARYFRALAEFCEERDILLVFDEVQTGFGRTGHMFAADYFGVSPHMMTVAKGISGAGFPLGGILTEERLAGLPKEQHGFTHGGSLISMAAAAATIEIVSAPGFLEGVRRVGGVLAQGLRALADRHPIIGDVRGAGLMLGVEIVADASARGRGAGGGAGRPADPAGARRLAQALFERGVIVRVSEHGRGNVIELRPPLILTEDQARAIVGRFAEACDVVARA